jgi:predicted GNAT family acetyltransferase
VRVTRHADAASFLAAAEAFLVEREALHNVPLAVARTCAADPARHAGRNYFVVVRDGARIVGIAAMTPPHKLQVYVPPGAAVDAVADDLAASAWTPPGVHGPVAASEAFAAAWCARRGVRAEPSMDLRAFELTEVIPAPPAHGCMRLAEDTDLPIVQSWYRAFHDEARLTVTRTESDETARRAIARRRLFVWDDGGAVAQTALVGSTPNGARIGAVYTPPDRRRRGYATALVEHVSRRALADGKRFCFLFTDLANPVSNSIYPKVGYRPVADYRDFEFVPAR